MEKKSKKEQKTKQVLIGFKGPVSMQESIRIEAERLGLTYSAFLRAATLQALETLRGQNGQ